MNQTALPSSTMTADEFGQRIAARLSQAAGALPYDVSERLRATRMQALAQRKRPAAQPVIRLRPAAATAQGRGPALALGGGEGGSWWRSIISAAWLAALLVGLAWVHQTQTESISSEITEVDTALLTDELPPSAYADPGFVQFIKSSRTGPNAPH